MDTFAQWLHQHSFLVVLCALLVGSFFLITWFQRWTKRTFIAWLSCLVLSVVVVLGLRTPAATVSEVVGESVAANSLAKSNMVNSAVPTDKSLEFSSTAEIESYLANSDKPTLVEFYSDLGIG